MTDASKYTVQTYSMDCRPVPTSIEYSRSTETSREYPDYVEAAGVFCQSLETRACPFSGVPITGAALFGYWGGRPSRIASWGPPSRFDERGTRANLSYASKGA